MNVNINLRHIYPLETIAPDLTKFTFRSPVLNKESEIITVKISEGYNAFLEYYLNLSFGPEKNGIIDDFAVIHHVDSSRMFSTVFYCALLYLKANPFDFLAIDGSDFTRAYWYYRILQRNYVFLQRDLEILGLKYFAMVLRGKDKFDEPAYDHEEGIYDAQPIENKPLTRHELLFNLVIFYLRLH